MSSKFGTHQLQGGKINCRCGKVGSIVWENARSEKGAQRDFVKIDGDFYERLSKRPPYPIELVCNSCGTAQPGPAQP
jgi:hypothetical protein